MDYLVAADVQYRYFSKLMSEPRSFGGLDVMTTSRDVVYVSIKHTTLTYFARICILEKSLRTLQPVFDLLCQDIYVSESLQILQSVFQLL